MPDKSDLAELVARLPMRADPDVLQPFSDYVRKQVRGDLDRGRLSHRRGHLALALYLQARDYPGVLDVATDTTRALRQLESAYRTMPDGMDLAFSRVEMPADPKLPGGDGGIVVTARWSDGETEITCVSLADPAPADRAACTNTSCFPKAMNALGGSIWWLVDAAGSPAYKGIAALQTLSSANGTVTARRIDVAQIEARLLDPRVNGCLNVDTDFLAVSRQAGDEALKGLLNRLEKAMTASEKLTAGEAMTDLMQADAAGRRKLVEDCGLIAASYYRSLFDIWFFHARKA